MTLAKYTPIKNWIKIMGFKLAKSHLLTRKSKKIKYYVLGNFGIYEVVPLLNGKERADKGRKFISWTPWGDDFEVTSVGDLNKAYEDSKLYNPTLN